MSALRTRVKICGITRLEDAIVADSLGVDALGFVFVPASKRHVSLDDAAAISAHLDPFTSVVGLFMDEQRDEVLRVLNKIPHLMPQFHGRESGDYCDGFGRPYIKAFGVGGAMPSSTELATFSNVSAFLFDSNEAGAMGGTGHAFDWNKLEEKRTKPLILAGGLDVENVASAVRQVAPGAVDVSSGVELSKGIKDPVAMRNFVKAVASADQRK